MDTLLEAIGIVLETYFRLGFSNEFRDNLKWRPRRGCSCTVCGTTLTNETFFFKEDSSNTLESEHY